MKLSVVAAACAFALLWGGAIFLTAVTNIMWPGYGREFLLVVASFYPGYAGTASFGQALVGAGYGVVDGAITAAIFAWLYNLFVSKTDKAGANGA
jgi:hypothetical protein